MRHPRRFRVLVGLLALALASAGASAYVLPVWDVLNAPLHYLNTFQNYVTMVKEIYAVEQRAQQIYQYYQQIDNYYRQLKNWRTNGTWNTLLALYGNVDDLLRRADTLGYTAPNLQALVAETFPDLPVAPDQWLDRYHLRLRRGLTTNNNLMRVLYSVGELNRSSQLRLRSAQAKSQDSDGQVQAIQSNTMLVSYSAEEAGRATQAILDRANSNAVRVANDFQDEINDDQLFQALLTQTPLSIENSPSYAGVPSGWTW
ncbi:MAG: hypothetical protein ABI609_01120 [Acidobacteriota bacterium]